MNELICINYVILFLFPILGVYYIGKGILYYIFGEEKASVVADRQRWCIKKCSTLYTVSVSIEDLSENIAVSVEDGFRLNHKNIGVGGKITVVLKKFNKCIYDRSYPIKYGLMIMAISVFSAILTLSVK